MNILFIEDNADLFYDWEEVLERHGYTVKCFQSAEKVIEKIEDIHQFDAFIIDIKLKGELTGIDAFRVIRKHSLASAIVLTASQNASDEAALIKIDPKVHCLSKAIHNPEHPEALLVRLEEFEAKLSWTAKVFDVYDFKFQIPGKKKKDSLKQDVIRCARKGEQLVALDITTQQFLILRKLLTDHIVGEGYGKTTRDNLMLALGRSPDEYTTVIETQISNIRGELPQDLTIKNLSGGYFFERSV